MEILELLGFGSSEISEVTKEGATPEDRKKIVDNYLAQRTVIALQSEEAKTKMANARIIASKELKYKMASSLGLAISRTEAEGMELEALAELTKETLTASKVKPSEAEAKVRELTDHINQLKLDHSKQIEEKENLVKDAETRFTKQVTEAKVNGLVKDEINARKYIKSADKLFKLYSEEKGWIVGEDGKLRNKDGEFVTNGSQVVDLKAALDMFEKEEEVKPATNTRTQAEGGSGQAYTPTTVQLTPEQLRRRDEILADKNVVA